MVDDHKSYVTMPKSYKPSITRQPRYPMLLRQRYHCHTIPQQNSFRHRAIDHLLAQLMNIQLFQIFNKEGKKEYIDTLIAKDVNTWGTSLSNEIDRLATGIRDVTGNEALTFISKSLVPKNKKVTYANMICDHQPFKK